MKNDTSANQRNLTSNSSRRNFVKGAMAGWVFLQSGAAMAVSSALADKPNPNKKLVWIFLRGALDSLHTVVPISDPNLNAYRQALIAPIKSTLLPLNSDFSLHPSLPFLHDLYKQKQMTPVVAVASGYRKRSHFDAQDQMESGLNITNHDDGWMARLTQQIQGQGVAISRSVPIALRGPEHKSQTWFPSGFAPVDDDLYTRLADLYESDKALAMNLADVIAQNENPNMQMKEKKRTNFRYLAKSCGELLASNNTMQCAMLEMGGWDTHNSQNGRLTRLFAQLDEGIKTLIQ